ncbi:7-carboxy-7-deazaguanine synthase QueE [Candidatus Magnetaquicoccus inordinatus]|uniref:7-carboxy-7-deazaguanine synthase QueE n=1 Tax=Candidatus Magnetaquicoccus inordinatus TaxID=2496818 RepID=UPI00187D610A|nr:7-carboxy-7-deazaguanine synthase QueE [Candidatus Magnetaquicoccus inordinatus]
MLFIRFHGCPLSCPWCDEPLHRDPNTRQDLLQEELLASLQKLNATLPYLLLTGGEPLAVPHLSELVVYLKQQGYWLAMETSGVGGTIPNGIDWITLSPKTPLPEEIYNKANEIKYIIEAPPSAKRTAEIVQRAIQHGNVWVQPRAQPQQDPHQHPAIDPQALAGCLQLIRQSAGKIRLSLQIHKWAHIP